MLPVRYAIALLSCLLAAPAMAGSITIANTTDIVAYSAGAPAAYFSGANPYIGSGAIGNEFATASLTVSAVAHGASVTLSFAYITAFSGSEDISGVKVGAADIFLRPGGGAYSGASFGYGISLGMQQGNGGLATGFYQVRQSATSQSLWDGRPGFIYGGAYTNSTQFLPGAPGYAAYPAPTVITAGRRLGDAIVASSALGGGLYRMDASIVLTGRQAELFGQGFDIFWGTGDCGNGSFLAQVWGLPVMEPASFMMLVLGSSLVMVVRQSRCRKVRLGGACRPPQTPRHS